MKKTAGILIVVFCFFLAGLLNFSGRLSFFSCMPKAASVSAADGGGYFPSINSQFKLFSDSVGVFILKENNSSLNSARAFSSGVGITNDSGYDNTGKAYCELYTDWRYEAVSADAGGKWHATDMLQVTVNPGLRSVSYSLPSAAPAGKYGIRVSAFLNGKNVYDLWGRKIEGIFVVMYAEELQYMYCADADGNMVYDVSKNGNKLDVIVSVSIFTNPGAVKYDSQGLENVDGFEVGNLNITADTQLNWHFEDAWGERFNEDRVIPTVAANGGVFNITLPTGLSKGNYVLRVYRDINDQVYGTYVINYGGVYASSGMNLADVAPVVFILGIVFLGGFAVMFILPKFAVRVNRMQYDFAEKKRFKKRQKDVLTAEFSGGTKRTLSKEELEKMTDAEKEELFKKRVDEARQTKGGKFLSTMAENRLKREYARDAGLTMDEFKEIEAKAKKVEGAKEVGLASFRKAVEEKTGIITQKQESTEKQDDKTEDSGDNHTKRPSGEPEFELLDSVKGSEEVIHEIEKAGGVAAAGSVSNVPKWKQKLLEDGEVNSIVDRPAPLESNGDGNKENGAKPDAISEGKFNLAGEEKFEVKEEKPWEKPENRIDSASDAAGNSDLRQHGGEGVAQKSDGETSQKTDSETSQKTDGETSQKTDGKSGVIKTSSRSILERLKRLAEENN